MTRKPKRGAKVAAAIAGAEEVAAELKGNEAAAAKFGAVEKGAQRTRSGNRNRRRAGTSGRVDMGKVSGQKTTFREIADTVLTSGKLSVEPKPILHQMYTGRVIGTELFQNRFFPNKPQVIVPAVGDVQVTDATGVHWFQSSTGNQDTNVDNVLGGTMKNMFNAIVREGASHAGKSFAIRDTTLDNNGTAVDSFSAYLSNYITAFMILRALQSAMAGGGLNYSMQLIANAVAQNLPRLTADLDRLYSFGMAPQIVKWLDMLCGVKYSDTNDPVIIAGLVVRSTDTQTLDVSTSANVQNFLTVAENNLNSLQTGVGGAIAFAPTDAQRISNVLSWAYGDISIVLDKGISNDIGEYVLSRYQGVTADGTTNNFSWPNENVTGPAAGYVPIIVPKNFNGDSVKLAFSLFRPYVISNDPIAGIVKANTPNNIGLFDNVPIASSPQGTHFAWYSQTGVYTDVALQNGTQLNFQNQELEALPWSAFAATALTSYTNESREYFAVDDIWTTMQWLIDETNLMMMSAFLDPIKLNGFNRVP